eukprot:3895937-Rhodomonas_salina.2
MRSLVSDFGVERTVCCGPALPHAASTHLVSFCLCLRSLPLRAVVALFESLKVTPRALCDA